MTTDAMVWLLDQLSCIAWTGLTSKSMECSLSGPTVCVFLNFLVAVLAYHNIQLAELYMNIFSSLFSCLLHQQTIVRCKFLYWKWQYIMSVGHYCLLVARQGPVPGAKLAAKAVMVFSLIQPGKPSPARAAVWSWNWWKSHDLIMLWFSSCQSNLRLCRVKAQTVLWLALARK